MIALEQKTLLTKKKKKKRRQKSSWHSDHVGSGLEYQYSACQRATAGAPKVSPQGGAVVFAWSLEENGLSYHLQPPGNQIHLPCWPHNICLSFQQQRSSGLIHKDGNIGEGFVMAKAFLYGEALLTFILRGFSRGGVTESSL